MNTHNLAAIAVLFAASVSTANAHEAYDVTQSQTVTNPAIHRGLEPGDLVVRSLNDTPWGYTVQNGVERFEVRSGDCGADPYHSDCATGRERSEVAVKKPIRGRFSISYEMRLDPSYTSVSPAQVYLGQLKTRKGIGNPPLFEISEYNGVVRSMGTVLFEVDSDWHSFHIQGDLATGEFRMTVDDSVVVETTLRIGDSYDHLRFKYGLYRNRISSYKRQQAGSNRYSEYADIQLPTQIVYYRNMNFRIDQ